jgi:UDP-3-O-[3-hydroxymyristoyl] glucosamine N-acyltransferase
MNPISKRFKEFSVKSLLQLWPDLLKPGADLNEDQLSLSIKQVCAFEAPESDSIVFIGDQSPDFLTILLANPEKKPMAIVISLNTASNIINELIKNKIIPLLSPNPKLAMALVSSKYFAQTRLDDHFNHSNKDIHPTAIIHSTAKLGKNVKIGPFVVVGANTVIGDNSKIASHVVIEDDATLGLECLIYSHVTIGWQSLLEDNCVVQSHSSIGSDGFGYSTDQRGQHFGIPHLGRVHLAKHVHIGAGVQIDRGTYGETYIGDFTKLDNLVHIAHNCKIGKSCLLTAGFLMAGSSTIGNFFVCGGGTSVTGHISIADNVQLAGLSGVQKSIPKPGKYGGYPVVPLTEHFKTLSSISKLVEFRKDLNKIMKHLKLNQD